MKRIVLSLLILIIFVTGCVSSNTDKVFIKLNDNRSSISLEADELPLYQAKVEINPYNYSYQGNLNFSTKLVEDLERLYFHLYMNAFKENYLPEPYLKEEKADVYVKGFDTGYIDIEYVKLDEQLIQYSIQGSILEIKLPQKMKKNERLQLTIGFNAKIPQIAHRTGYNDNAIWLGNWLPILAVKDENGWNLDPYYAMGDPFYSKMAKYNLSILTPNGYQVVSTGVSKNVEIKDNEKITNINTEAVRDVALWISAKPIHIERESNDGIRINYWGYDKLDYEEYLLNVAANTLEYFEDRLGPYPYKEIDIVETEMTAGGMEYPGLVQISGKVMRESQEQANFVLIHELIHQWCYNVIGNNQIKEPWIDEALTNYLTYEFIENYIPEKDREKLWQEQERELYNLLKSTKGTIGSSVTAFSEGRSYALVVYEKGTFMFKALREEMGQEKFAEFLKEYYNRYQGKEVNRELFINLVSEVGGKDYQQFFVKWLDS